MDPLNAYLFTQPLYVPVTCYMLHLSYVSSQMICTLNYNTYIYTLKKKRKIFFFSVKP